MQPLAALLALLLPGLGHAYLGQVRRGVLICAGVLGLFASGVLIGGITCVDRRENFIWFLGQALVGPVALGVDWVNQEHFKVRGPEGLRPAKPNEFRNPVDGRPLAISMDGTGKTWVTFPGPGGSPVTVSPAYPPAVRGLGRMNELGTLFTTIAGFMNLICILDVLWYHRTSPRERATAPGSTSISRTLAQSTGLGGVGR